MDLTELIEALTLIQEEHEDESFNVEVHYQPNYPLKSRIQNVRILNGKVAIAIGDGIEYGESNAWNNEWEDED